MGRKSQEKPPFTQPVEKDQPAWRSQSRMLRSSTPSPAVAATPLPSNKSLTTNDDYNALRRFTSLLLSNKTPQKAHIPVTSLYSEYCRLYELISSHGAARTPEVEQLCDSIDARLDNEEQLSPLQSSARSMIGLTMMRLRRRIGAQPWVDGGELGKRCYRLGISIIDMAMCDRGGPSIL
ncbi:unnamed protein product, partial [Mesorhabditis spiculigera]